MFRAVSSVPVSCWGAARRKGLAEPQPYHGRVGASTDDSSALTTYSPSVSAWVLCCPKMTLKQSKYFNELLERTFSFKH